MAMLCLHTSERQFGWHCVRLHHQRIFLHDLFISPQTKSIFIFNLWKSATLFDGSKTGEASTFHLIEGDDVQGLLPLCHPHPVSHAKRHSLCNPTAVPWHLDQALSVVQADNGSMERRTSAHLKIAAFSSGQKERPRSPADHRLLLFAELTDRVSSSLARPEARRIRRRRPVWRPRGDCKRSCKTCAMLDLRPSERFR